CGVLTPDAATLDALVTAEANVKRGRSVAEGLVGQLADDGIANDPVAAAPSAPVISSVRLAFQDGLLPGDVLAGAGQIEGVESAKCRKVRRRESRLGHVEVFRMDGVRTSIIGSPRRLSAQRRAVSWNHRSTLSFTKSRITPPIHDSTPWRQSKVSSWSVRHLTPPQLWYLDVLTTCGRRSSCFGCTELVGRLESIRSNSVTRGILSRRCGRTSSVR